MGSSNNSEKKYIVRWQLVGYDLLMFIGVCAFVGYIYGPMTRAPYLMSTLYTALAFVSVLIFRFWLKCYQIIIRYGGVGVYLRLILADCLGIMCYVPLKFALHRQSECIMFQNETNMKLALEAGMVKGDYN